MTFQVARVERAMGSVSQMVKNGNKLVFDQDSNGKDCLTSRRSELMRKYGCDRKWCVRPASDGGTPAC